MALFRKTYFTFLFLIISASCFSQNSMVGDGFGGRLWYKPTNYTVGSYSAYSLCYANPCDSSTNQLYAWGSNIHDELGIGVGTGVVVPTAVPGMTNLKYYSTGYNMGAIKNDGTGWAWGAGLFSTPTQVITDAKFLDGSIDAISFVKNDGTVWSIGNNTYGNFGNGTAWNNSIVPIQMQGINNAVRVANGNGTTYVLLADGTVKSVGNNYGGSGGNIMLGNNNPLSFDIIPSIIPSLDSIIDLKAHTLATAALSANGEVYVWGDGNSIGDGDNTDEGVPKKIDSLNDIIAISGCADGYHFMALDKDKNCYAWGTNYGQMNAGDPSVFGNYYILTPKLVATDVIDIMAGETFSYIVKSDGTLWCSGISGWSTAGSNYGSIWLNLLDSLRTTFTQINPSQVPGACSIVASNATTNPSCSNNNTGIITVNHSSGLPPYQFNIGNGNQSSNVFTGLAAGNYTITISDANACVTTVTCTVNSAIGATPTINVNSPTMCSDNSVTLNASGANTYIWTNSTSLNTNTGPSVIASPTTTTIYNVVGTSSAGCSSSTTATVTVVPLPIITSSNDSICSGESVNLNAIGANTYNWSPVSSLNTSSGANVIASPNTTTNYTLTSNNGTCTSNQTIQVAVYSSPIANFTSNIVDSLIINSSIQLTNTSNNASNIEWLFCDYSISTDNTIDFEMNQLGTCCIKLKAEKNNCHDSISKCFVVYQPFYITIPNVFSPNGDGKNDVYKMDASGINTFHCEIYNRWGQKLYEWDGINGYWDGKTKNGIASDGTYYYIINYTTPDLLSKTAHGFITLTR